MAIPVKNLGMDPENGSKVKGMGWRPELPDFRDYTLQTEEVAEIISPLKISKIAASTQPESVDLRKWFSPIEDQKELGSCAANAGAGIYEYFERRAFGEHIDVSRLFLYKVTRDLMQETGDTGAYLRTTMGAMVLFGVPPERYWPYDTSKFDEEPSAFLFGYACNFKALKYVNLDPPGTSASKLLSSIKKNIASGIPSIFGFTVYNSIEQAGKTGKIPYPCKRENVLGGHAVAAMGYDDKMKIKNTACGTETTGALMIRNSWGEGWGNEGYGWIPYDYVLTGLAGDWWTLIKGSWIATGQFEYQ